MEFLHRAVIDDDGQAILHFSLGNDEREFSILSCLHRCRWCLFLLYLLFVALLRPVGFLLQNRGNITSNVWKSRYMLKIRLAHWLAVSRVNALAKLGNNTRGRGSKTSERGHSVGRTLCQKSRERDLDKNCFVVVVVDRVAIYRSIENFCASFRGIANSYTTKKFSRRFRETSLGTTLSHGTSTKPCKLLVKINKKTTAEENQRV